MLFCRLPTLFKINFFEKFFQEYHQSVKQFGSRSGQCFVEPDLALNCLYSRLSADEISRQRELSLSYQSSSKGSFYKYQISHFFFILFIYSISYLTTFGAYTEDKLKVTS